MNPIVRNVLAVVFGIISGSVANMSLVNLGHYILPIEGLDPSDMEAMVEIMPTLSYEYFVFPFLAHAVGTFVGGFLAYTIAVTKRMIFAFSIGFFFLLGGITVNLMIPGPIWFALLDIVVAYIPMAWLAGILAKNLIKKEGEIYV